MKTMLFRLFTALLLGATGCAHVSAPSASGAPQIAMEEFMVPSGDPGIVGARRGSGSSTWSMTTGGCVRSCG